MYQTLAFELASERSFEIPNPAKANPHMGLALLKFCYQQRKQRGGGCLSGCLQNDLLYFLRLYPAANVC
jgi:hypothetical protein